MPSALFSRARLHATLGFAVSLIVWLRIGGVFVGSLVVCAASLAALAWLAPRRYEPIQRGFDAVTRTVLKVISWSALAVVYVGLFMPLRLWRALTRNDPLHRMPDANAATYLQPLKATPVRRFDRQF